ATAALAAARPMVVAISGFLRDPNISAPPREISEKTSCTNASKQEGGMFPQNFQGFSNSAAAPTR
ncbi:MAG TPA: hypothetical protein VJ299_14565, partial [Steroidobacteraceae bacterium]|nr:hypothetical protein [Steroidobacteraceae bacterium]